MLRYLDHFFLHWVVCFWLSFTNSFYILDKSPLSDVSFVSPWLVFSFSWHNFDRNYIESIDQAGENLYLDNIEYSYSWAWNICIYLVFYFIYQSFIVCSPGVLCIFVIFTPEYFIWGAANVDGIVLLTSNSICSLLLYRKEFDFCILTLHLSTLLWLVISFKISLLIISDYLHKISYHLWMRMLLFLLPISIHFIPFSCLIALARTSSMMLKRRCWKRRHLALS